jgi:hypothetical protein
MAINKNIRNYTSQADPAQSILLIEKMIIKCGAREISKIYDGFGNPSGIKFILPVDNMQMTFDMQANIDLVYEYMLKQYDRKPTEAQIAACKKQATRTSWKNIMELLQIQLDMVAINQKEMMEALLLMLTNGHQTFYARVKETQFKGFLLDK